MKKKVFLIPTFIVGMALVACSGGDKPTPEPIVEYNASLKMTEAMNIDNVKAFSNTDYDTKITVKNEFIGYCAVPEALYEVHVDGVLLGGDQYTYTRDSDSEARLHIPSNNVNGNIEIFTEAKADTISIKLGGEMQMLSLDREEAIVGSGCEVNISLLKEEYKSEWSVPDDIKDLQIICKDSHDGKEYDLTHCCTYAKKRWRER